jgi:hypothetical protein
VGTPLADTSIGGAYDLSSDAKCVAARNATNNPASLGAVVSAASGASSNVPVAVTPPTACTTGSDGKGAAYNDATVATLLTWSLWTQA